MPLPLRILKASFLCFSSSVYATIPLTCSHVSIDRVTRHKDSIYTSARPQTIVLDPGSSTVWGMSARNVSCEKAAHQISVQILIFLPLLPLKALFRASLGKRHFICDVETRDRGDGKTTIH